MRQGGTPKKKRRDGRQGTPQKGSSSDKASLEQGDQSSEKADRSNQGGLCVSFEGSVIQAKGLTSKRGQGRALNSFVRLQLFGDSKFESECVKDSTHPSYNYSFEKKIPISSISLPNDILSNLDDSKLTLESNERWALVDHFISQGISLTIIEGVPGQSGKKGGSSGSQVPLYSCLVDPLQVLKYSCQSQLSAASLLTHNQQGGSSRISSLKEWIVLSQIGEEIRPSSGDSDGTSTPPTKPQIEISFSIFLNLPPTQPGESESRECLVSSDDFEKSNILELSFDSVPGLQPLPNRWIRQLLADKSQHSFEYTLSLDLPFVTPDGPTSLLFGNGEVFLPKPAKEPSSSSSKRQKTQQQLPDTIDPIVQSDAYIKWSASIRKFLDPVTISKWQSILGEEDGTALSFQAHVSRRPVPVKSGASAIVDPNQAKYCGVAELNLSSFAVAGTENETFSSSVRSTYVPPSTSEAKDVTQSEGEIQEEQKQAAKPSSAESSRRGKRSQKRKEQQKDKGPEKSQSERQEEIEVDDPFAEAGSCLNNLQVRFLVGPLIKKPETPREVLKVIDFIPKRQAFPPLYRLKEATDEFRDEIKRTIRNLATEYVELNLDDPKLTAVEKKKQFFFELNHNGLYFTFKEKLKRSIVRVVREKFHKNAFESSEDREDFLGNLYTYLVDEMHSAIDELTIEKKDRRLKSKPQNEDSDDSQRAFTSCNSTQGLTRLSQDLDLSISAITSVQQRGVNPVHYDQANKFYEELVAKCPADPVRWLDYAIHCLQIGDTARAEECLRESISISHSDDDSLSQNGVVDQPAGPLSGPQREARIVAHCLFGSLACQNREYQRAEPFLIKGAELADSGEQFANTPWSKLHLNLCSPPSYVFHTLLAILYEEMDLVKLYETSQLQAFQSFIRNSDQPVEEEATDSQEERNSEKLKASMFCAVGKFLIENHLANLAEIPLNKAIACCGKDFQVSLLLGHAFLQQHLQQEQPQTDMFETDDKVGEKKRINKLECSLEQVEESREMKPDSYEPLLLLGDIRIARQDIEGAAIAYQAALNSLDPQPKLEQAETSEEEQNKEEGEEEEKEEQEEFQLVSSELSSLDFESRLKIKMKVRLSELFHLQGKYAESKSFSLSACSMSPSALSWTAVGRACLGLKENEECSQALAEANLYDPSNAEIWGMLCLADLRKENGEEEAEGCLTECTRLGMASSRLWKEIGEEYVKRIEENIGDELKNHTLAKHCLTKSIEFPCEKEDFDFVSNLVKSLNSPK